MIHRLASLFFSLFPAALLAGPTHVLLICVDDLRPELGCYGVDYVESPHIDRLAAGGTLFSHHYVQAPTCGSSRYALLTGTYDRAMNGNGALFHRAKSIKLPPERPSLPRHFRDHGYTTVSIGKVSHHPGGRGGPDWDDDSRPEMPEAWNRHLLPAGPWQHPRGFMHGLAHGEIRKRAKDMAVYQSEPGPDNIYPDGLTTEGALEQLDLLKEAGKPFFLAVGILRPHLPFGAPAEYFKPYDGLELPPIPHPQKPPGKTTWHGSGEFMKYKRWGRDPRQDPDFADEVRRHYAACVSYADAQVGRLLARLDALDLANDTVVVLWGDHGWHLGEHAVWGKHTLFEESLRSPLILRQPGSAPAGARFAGVCETVDVYPTLCQAAGLPVPEWTDGRSLLPLVDDPDAAEGSAISYHGRHRTIRTATHRLIAHRDGFMELYDHRRDPGETNNIAESRADTADALLKQLEKRWQR